jgi:hypothetical protein
MEWRGLAGELPIVQPVFSTYETVSAPGPMLAPGQMDALERRCGGPIYLCALSNSAAAKLNGAGTVVKFHLFLTPGPIFDGQR